MEDWLKLINAETEGDLMEIQQTTNIPEVQDTIVMIRHLSADEKIREEAYYREKQIHDEVSALNSAKREGMAEGIAKGKAEGEAIGIVKGRAEGKAEGEAIGIVKGEAAARQSIAEIMRKKGYTEKEILELTGDDNV